MARQQKVVIESTCVCGCVWSYVTTMALCAVMERKEHQAHSTLRQQELAAELHRALSSCNQPSERGVTPSSTSIQTIFVSLPPVSLSITCFILKSTILIQASILIVLLSFNQELYHSKNGLPMVLFNYKKAHLFHLPLLSTIYQSLLSFLF